MSWVDVLPPVVSLNGVEVVYPYLKGASSEDCTPSAEEVFTQIRLAGAATTLTRAQVSALVGALTGILETERRTDLKRQAELDAKAMMAPHLAERESLFGKIR
jgi:hypothetical protein